jgi:hypothetical protein
VDGQAEQGEGVAAADRLLVGLGQAGRGDPVDRVGNAHVERVVAAEDDAVGADGLDEVA